MMNAEPPNFLKRGAHLGALYRIRGWKGGGAYGDVYEGESKGRPYALKLSKHRQSSDDPGKTDQRMLRELVCLVQLDHPNIAKVEGWTRTKEGYGLLAMEFVKGWTLAEWLQQTRPTFAQVLHVFSRLAGALAYMHARGVRHRDVSLLNVMVRKADGEPVVVDLGAGEYSGAPELTDWPLPPGTDRYRSPEAARFLKEHQNDPSARYDFPPEDDFYSLAVCLYDALTDAETALKAGARKAPRLKVNSPTMAPPPARKVNPRVPEAVSAWVERWLVRDVETRRPALAAMPGALEELAKQGGAEWLATVQPPPDEGPPAPEHRLSQKRWRVLAWALAAGVLAVVAALSWLRVAPAPHAPPSRAAPQAPSTPRAAAPDMPPTPPAPSPSAVPSPSQVSPLEKESPSVSVPTQPPPSPSAAKKPRKAAPVFSPEFLKKCAVAGASAAALMGCPGPQVTPTRETCPKEAVRAAQERDLEDGAFFDIAIDVSQPCPPGEWCNVTLKDGPIESVVRRGRYGMPDGTRLYGHVWTGGEEVVARYTRAVIPPVLPPGAPNYYAGGERDFPICAVLGNNGGAEKREGSKPGAARVRQSQSARIIHGRWP